MFFNIKYVGISMVFLWSTLSWGQIVSGKSYRLITTCGTGTGVISTNNSTADGANMFLANRDNSSASQIFKIEVSGSGYKLTAQNSGKALDIPTNVTALGAPLTQYAANGNTNQQFAIKSTTTSGVYQIQNIYSKLNIDLAGANTSAGTRIQQYTANTTCAQRFKIEEVTTSLVSGKSYQIFTTCGDGSRVLAVYNSSLADGAKIVLAARNDSSLSQIFKAQLQGSQFKFSVAQTGKMLDIPTNVAASGAPLTQYAANSGTNQLFNVKAASSGIYQLQNVYSGLYIDLAGANTAIGTALQQYASNTSCAQKFKFVETTVSAPAPAPAPSPTPTTSTLMQDAIESMTVKNDLFPINVNKSFDWMVGPKLGTYASKSPPSDWTAMVPWGEFYMGETNSVSNPKAEIRNLEVWVLSKSTNQWSRLAVTNALGGALYNPTYNNETKPATTYAVSGGGVGVTITNWPYHFYPNRMTANLADIADLFVRGEARLAPGTSSSAVVLIHLAADYWKSLTAPWTADYSTSGDVMISRIERVTSQWQWINAHTLTESQLKANPPPFLK